MDFVARSVIDKGGNVFIETTMTGENGRQVQRTLNIEDFLHVLGKSIDKEVPLVPIKKDFFPKDYLSLNFGNYENYDCSFVVEPEKRVFVYRDGNHYHIPYPKLLFKVSRRKNYITGRVFALRSNGKSKKLYQYPFGNVADNGQICMGNIERGSIESVQDFAEEFFLGVTNDDYIGNGSRVKPGYNQSQLLNKLEKLDEFPDRWLVECNSVKYADIVA